MHGVFGMCACESSYLHEVKIDLMKSHVINNWWFMEVQTRISTGEIQKAPTTDVWSILVVLIRCIQKDAKIDRVN